jgi:hypothetical protein
MILSHLPGRVLNPAPGFAQLHAIKILHHDNFLPSRQLVPRYCASAVFQLHLPGLFPSRLSNLYRDRACTQKNLYPDGKKHAIPSLHRDNFPAKVPGPCPDAASGKTTSLYFRAVRGKLGNIGKTLVFYKKNSYENR